MTEWIAGFRDFCKHLQIDSKETGVGPLEPYGSQEVFLREIEEGWRQGIHSFSVVKSRQLGISTITTALDLYWCMVFPGIQGAVITHDEPTHEEFRSKIARYLDSLPRSHKRGAHKFNRNRLEFSNGSVINFMIAGSRSKGTLGRALGLNFLHATECSSWGDEEGVMALRNSLAETYPHRLYIWESTARGFNLWERMWQQAGEDPTQKRFFIGWYTHPGQRVERTDPRFAKYWQGELTAAESERSDVVHKLYGHQLAWLGMPGISPEQVAWYRWKMASTGDEVIGQQEQPWHQDEAFVMTGSSFFQQTKLTERMRALTAPDTDVKFLPYRYEMGDDFFATRVHPCDRDPHLRVWQQPVPDGVYVLGADPTYGANEDSDLGVVEVYRAYADRLVQVAEYSWPNVSTTQFAWVIAHLMGVYRGAMVNLEINGPGEAVFQELQRLRQVATLGALQTRMTDHGFADVFSATRWYLYHRVDSTGTGLALMWKTFQGNKRRIMNQLKDSFEMGIMTVNSAPMVEEMRTVTYIGGTIGAEGRRKDDRVMASALAIVTWMDWVRGQMLGENRTYERECEMERAAAEGRGGQTFQQALVENFFSQQSADRNREAKPWYEQ